MAPKAEAAGAAIDWMDWAIKVRERAEKDGIEPHAAFGVVKLPERAWARIVRTGTSSPNPALVIAVYEDMRSRVVKLAGSLVGVKLTSRVVGVKLTSRDRIAV